MSSPTLFFTYTPSFSFSLPAEFLSSLSSKTWGLKLVPSEKKGEARELLEMFPSHPLPLLHSETVPKEILAWSPPSHLPLPLQICADDSNMMDPRMVDFFFFFIAQVSLYRDAQWKISVNQLTVVVTAATIPRHFHYTKKGRGGSSVHSFATETGT